MLAVVVGLRAIYVEFKYEQKYYLEKLPHFELCHKTRAENNVVTPAVMFWKSITAFNHLSVVSGPIRLLLVYVCFGLV